MAQAPPPKRGFLGAAKAAIGALVIGGATAGYLYWDHQKSKPSKDLGDSCEYDTECISTNCSAKVCRATDTELGGACEDDKDCVSKRCSAKTCVAK